MLFKEGYQTSFDLSVLECNGHGNGLGDIFQVNIYLKAKSILRVELKVSL